ncbi:hypothetical protein EI94DRAFT_1804306 [Lactarius quietus]|nr:hypothetical protein EI94DRAFT_1804306 [Lactarius quietus]
MLDPVLSLPPDRPPPSLTESLSHSCRSYKFKPTPAPSVEVTSFYFSESSPKSCTTAPFILKSLNISNVSVLPQSTPQEQTLKVTMSEVSSTPSPLVANTLPMPPSVLKCSSPDHSPASAWSLSTVEVSSSKFNPPKRSLSKILPSVPALSLETSKLNLFPPTPIRLHRNDRPDSRKSIRFHICSKLHQS